MAQRNTPYAWALAFEVRADGRGFMRQGPAAGRWGLLPAHQPVLGIFQGLPIQALVALAEYRL